MVTTYHDNVAWNLCLLYVRKKKHSLFLKSLLIKIIYFYIDFRFNFLLTRFVVPVGIHSAVYGIIRLELAGTDENFDLPEAEIIFWNACVRQINIFM